MHEQSRAERNNPLDIPMSHAEDRGVRLRGPLAAGQQHTPLNLAWRQEKIPRPISPSKSTSSLSDQAETWSTPKVEISSVQSLTTLEAENVALRRRVAALESLLAEASSSASMTHDVPMGLDIEGSSSTQAVAAGGSFWPELVGRVSWLVRKEDPCNIIVTSCFAVLHILHICS